MRIDSLFDIAVDTKKHTRYDLPVEIRLPWIDYSIAVNEVDGSGNIIDENVPFQIESTSPFHKEMSLVFLVKGNTPKGISRVFKVVKSDLKSPRYEKKVVARDGIEHEGQDSIKIESTNAVYLYHKKGSAFASMIDREGNDWISYHPFGGSDGKYRGIPNLVHPEVHLHPGPGSEGDRSVILQSGPVRVRIKSDTGDGLWSCVWDIYPEFARLTVLKCGHPYWFLYEGTPYGRLSEETNYYVTSDGSEKPASEKFAKSLPKPKWIYFGDISTSRFLYLYNHQNEDCIDYYKPMEGNMTVFGFGRDGLQKHLEKTPAVFTIGFGEGADFKTAAKRINSNVCDTSVKIL